MREAISGRACGPIADAIPSSAGRTHPWRPETAALLERERALLLRKRSRMRPGQMRSSHGSHRAVAQAAGGALLAQPRLRSQAREERATAAVGRTSAHWRRRDTAAQRISSDSCTARLALSAPAQSPPINGKAAITRARIRPERRRAQLASARRMVAFRCGASSRCGAHATTPDDQGRLGSSLSRGRTECVVRREKSLAGC